MRIRTLGLALGLLLAATASGRAQVAWDSPMLMSTAPEPGVGIFLIDPAFGDVGAMVTWRGSARPGGVGFRAGVAEDRGDDLSVFGGVDISGGLTRASRDFPLDIAWVAGAGGGIGDDVLLSFPLGLTVGHTFTGDGVRFAPYLTPRIVLDAFFGGPGDELDLDFAADLGLDLAFRQGWLIRFGATLGNDREGLAIGLVF